MKRFVIVMVSIFFIMALMSTNEILRDNEEGDIEFREAVSDYVYKNTMENNCFTFVTEKLSDGGAIHTNYRDSNVVKDIASGHQVLSESVGLMMLYCSRNDIQSSFDVHYKYLSDNMILDNDLVSWRYIDNDTPVYVSSSIDDLRIVRALLFAYTRWGEDKYFTMAKKIGNALLNNATTKGMVTDYYDKEHDQMASTVTLAYLDLYTMDLLKRVDVRWSVVSKTSRDLIENGYISDKLPLYKDKKFVSSDEYTGKKILNMTEAMVTILHLSEVGLTKKETVDWLKNSLKADGKIYTYYDMSGTAQSVDESTAIYSLVCRIGKQIDDEELYNLAFKKMANFYIADKASPIYGSFGNKETLEVFSFDNLQGLLAF